MARHFGSESRVVDVKQKLSGIFCKLGEVSALQALLNEQLPEGTPTIHPNRIHTILSGDNTRSINSQTLSSVELALSHLGGLQTESFEHATKELIHKTALTLAIEDSNLLMHAIAKKLSYPPGVVQALLGDYKPEERTRQNTRQAPPSSTGLEFSDDAFSACFSAINNGNYQKIDFSFPLAAGKQG